MNEHPPRPGTYWIRRSGRYRGRRVWIGEVSDEHVYFHYDVPMRTEPGRSVAVRDYMAVDYFRKLYFPALAEKE